MIELKIKDYGTIKIELDRKEAPNTCANFTELVKKGFYDGLIFHRVIRHFMIQGGDPKGNGTGGSKETIKGEFDANGFRNTLKHTRGVLSMARTYDPNSASSQFFIRIQQEASFSSVTQMMISLMDNMQPSDML